jgi:benzoate-CoA ligase family protein
MVSPGLLRAADLPVRYNAVQILEDNLARRPDKAALLTAERTMTFREVSREANRVGNALRRLEVHFGETVGLLCLDGAEWVTSFFGILKIGAVALGMNTLLKADEQAYALTDARARVLIVHRELLPLLATIRKDVSFLEHVVVVGGEPGGERGYAEWIAGESEDLATCATHREDFCSLNYSSGTTGEPKGILHAHKDYPITAQLVGLNALGLREEDRTFAASKLFFTFGLGGNLIFPWYVGASVVLYPGSPRIPANVFEAIQSFKPTILFNAPTGYAAMLATPDFTTRYDLRSLRLCVSAGEALPAPIFLAWKERTGLEIVDGIGSTENFHMFVAGRPGKIRPGATGVPIEGYDVRLEDDEGNDVPTGQIGNLWVRGETSALAYLHQYAASRATFRGEWLRTGDKYFVDEEGYFWHAGRSDDMLKVGGIWVSPVEVESALLAHPAVLECAVVGQADAAGLIKPKAYVVLKDQYPAAETLAAELIAFCRARMADYKRPRSLEVVTELPKTATGKIQRFKLRGQARISVTGEDA